MKFVHLEEADMNPKSDMNPESDMDPMKEKKFNSKFREVVADMAQNTAMHGLPNVTGRKELHKKIFWIIVLLTASGILIWQIEGLIVKFYTYPVSTTTELVFNSKLDFPAVTFCNLNPVRQSYEQKLPPPMQTIMNKSAISKPPRPGGQDSTGDEYTAEREDYENFEDFYNQFLALPEEVRQDAGHQIDDMLLDCSWKGITCGPANFTRFNNWQYGNCFTFNAGLDRAIEISKQSGPLQGLTLRLYVQSYEYVPSLSSSIGVKMVIHNQSSMPFPDSEGFMIGTGTWAQIGLKTVYISREDPPHGDCVNYTNSEAAKMTAYMDVLKSTQYTRQGCVNTCKQKIIMKTCSCGSSTYPMSGTAFVDTNPDWLEPCAWSNETLQACVKVADFASNAYCTSIDQCPDRCVDLQYPVTMSRSYWPTTEQSTSTWNGLVSLAMDTNDSAILAIQNHPDDQASFVRQNVMVVQIYLEDLSHLSYTTAESFTVEDFLSSLGGTFGLWLGMSVVTICELLEFFLNLFAMCFKFGKKKKVEDMDSDQRSIELQKKVGKFETFPGYPPSAGVYDVAASVMKKK